MRILQLCLRVPFPPKDGAAIAMNSLTQGLVENNCSVTVLALNTPKHYVDCSIIPKSYLKNISFKAIDVNVSINPLSALISFFTPKHSYNISRFYSKDFENEITRVLKAETFDVVLFESLFMTPYFSIVKKATNAKLILRSHNVEFTIWQNLALHEKNPIKKFYLNHLTKRLKEYEINYAKKFSGIACISPVDKTIYHQLNINIPTTTVYCGVNNELFLNNNNPQRSSLYHIGSMDWLPNKEGIEWFITKIWPLIKQQAPEIECRLAGRKMPKEFLNLHLPDLYIQEYIEDANAFQAENNVLIVPLLTGSGIRIKIIEALALGKAIVTTPKGAEGLPLEHLKNIFIAETPEQFAHWAIEAIRNKPLAETIAKEAQLFARNHFSNKSIAENLITFVKSL